MAYAVAGPSGNQAPEEVRSDSKFPGAGGCSGGRRSLSSPQGGAAALGCARTTPPSRVDLGPRTTENFKSYKYRNGRAAL